MSDDIRNLIDRYVDSLKEDGWIKSTAVERAFRRVQRHQFIEQVYRGKDDILQVDPTNPEHLAMIYSNKVLLTRP